MVKKIFLTGLILLLGVSICDAKKRVVRKRKKRYSLQDSLRGGISEERICYDVYFYDLTVDFNLKDSSIVGSNEIAFNVLKATSKIQLDLFKNLSVDSVLFNGDALNYTRVGNAFFVNFPTELKQGAAEKVKVFYHGNPVIAKKAPWDGGFVWSEDKKGRPFVGVACEGLGASSWWPNKDHLSDKPDSMRLNFIVPKGLDCVANGVKVFSKPHKNDISKTHFQWKVQYPIVNYNVTFYLGNFETITDYYVSEDDTLVLSYHVLDYNVEKATKHFEQVKPMLKIYEELYGKYPFWKDGYKLVDAPYLGMEHQSAIAYGNQYKTGYLGRQMEGVDFDYVIIHESGHEYWGNSITMKDLADMWIHEAFCTYTEALYVEKRYDYETMVEYIKHGSLTISNDKAIIPAHHVNQKGSNDMYLKGAMMLHVVREQLGEDSLWFATLKNMHSDFAFKSVGTKEVLQYLKIHLGAKVVPIFEHYLNMTALPVLAVQKMKNKYEYMIQWYGVSPGFHMSVAFETKNGSELIEVGDSAKRFMFEKIKSKEPKVINSVGAFTLRYR